MKKRQNFQNKQGAYSAKIFTFIATFIFAKFHERVCEMRTKIFAGNPSV